MAKPILVIKVDSETYNTEELKDTVQSFYKNLLNDEYYVAIVGCKPNKNYLFPVFEVHGISNVMAPDFSDLTTRVSGKDLQITLNRNNSRKTGEDNELT